MSEEEKELEEVVIEDAQPAPLPEKAAPKRVDNPADLLSAQELTTKEVEADGFVLTLQQISTADLSAFLREANKKANEEDDATYMVNLGLVARCLIKSDGAPLFESPAAAYDFLGKCRPRLVRKLMAAAVDLNPYSDDAAEAEAKN